MFDDVHDDLVRFCARRTDTASAEDVAADALLTAWRRFDDAPLSHDGRRAWVYGIARNQLLNAARSAGRRGALAVRMTKTAPLPSGVTEDEAVLRADLSAAWARLTPAQQEVLALTVWDGLDATQAGAVLDISALAYRLRLSRARKALRAHLHLTASPARVTSPGPSRTTTTPCEGASR
ncbi:RNA polymerase sigma factor [Arsenicicoccus bolidensis]|uniref:RNA polymerase sigma factor n=1 Tax=Arsenicicoccus bolidensis TaxID=229480 RepID=UPI0028AA4AA0|nr:RNA polymerase sigma factor [Arsenicicoccus bolidensis]